MVSCFTIKKFLSHHQFSLLSLSMPTQVKIITFGSRPDLSFLRLCFMFIFFIRMEYKKEKLKNCMIYELQQSFTTIAKQMKRQGSDIAELERQAKSSNKLCFWGIQKFFDTKQCYRHFKKNFGDNDAITHICKMKNKPFYIIKFNKEINCDEFNKNFAKNKRTKARIPTDDVQEKNNIKEQDYMTIEDIKKPGQKLSKEATPQQLQKIKNTKIEDIVAPLHSLPYPQQVQQKIKQINRVLQNYNTNYFRDAQVKRLMKEQAKDIQPLKMNQFIECATNRQGYRSKSQFTIGEDEEGHAVVGFNKGSYHNNTIMVETPKKVNIISKNTKLIVALMENYLRKLQEDEEFGEFKPFNRIQSEGFWRYLVVRESQRTKQSMIIVVCKTDGFEEEKVNKIKENLIEFLRQSVIGLKSLCFLPYNGQADSIPTEKPLLLWGQPFYQQKIFDHTFQVSPSAFLQIHIDMCQVLYQKIIDEVKECEIILDLGCGIGTIGISIMKKVPNVKVIGIQICQQAVQDARKNEPNYQVHLGRAQDLIKTICDQHRGKRIVAILDPPRPGFNKEVMQALRRCRGLDNLIYVACNAGAIQDNLLQLTLPTTVKRKAPEFEIKKMYGFDLFPQTSHFEALYIMERRQ